MLLNKNAFDFRNVHQFYCKQQSIYHYLTSVCMFLCIVKSYFWHDLWKGWVLFPIIHPLLVVLLLANFPKYVFLKKHPFKLNVNFGVGREAVCFVPWSISFLSIFTITKNQCCLCQWSMAHTKKSWKYIFKTGTTALPLM